MKFMIELSEKDIEAVMNTTLTVDEMYETRKGRIYCAIAHGVHEHEKEVQNSNNAKE